MKLSTKSRYGTRLLLEMSIRYKNGDKGTAIQLSDISRTQDISLKYLEQIIIPLKKSKYIKGIRGAKGGYILQKAPEKITVGEIVELFEGSATICNCTENLKTCRKAKSCVTRHVWLESGNAMFEKMNSITFADLVEKSVK